MRAHAGFGEAFNIAFGQRTTVAQLASHLMELLGVTIQPIHVQPRAGDVRHSLADISKAKALLGYRPSTSLLAGLRHTVEWHYNHGGDIS